MPEPMSPERLAEIRNSDTWKIGHGEALTQRRELLAEVDRLTPRQITTVEELEALPEYAVLVDFEGDVWHKRYADEAPWVMAGLASEPETNSGMLLFAPLLLVHVPLDGAR